MISRIVLLCFGGVLLSFLLPRQGLSQEPASNLPFFLSDAQQLASERTPLECTSEEILRAANCLGDGWEPEEEQLYQMINAYRTQQGLPTIAQSPSLTLIANRHILDMTHNIGHLSHSWSDCPYDPSDRRTFVCSSRVAQRLGTKYRGKTYENAHYNARGATANSAFNGWQNSPSHNALISNLGNWRDNRWRAMGIGIYRQYAVLWLGEERDPETNSVAAIDPANRSTQTEAEPNRRCLVRLLFVRICIGD